MTPTQYVLLIIAGGAGTPLLVFAIARALVHRHAEQHGQAHAAAARLEVRAAEQHAAAKRAGDRPKELTR